MLFKIIFLISVQFVSNERLVLDEGVECTLDGVSGRCVSANQCMGSVLDKHESRNASVCYYRDKEPIICCTDCQLVNDTRMFILNDKYGILIKTGQKAEDACLEFKNSIEYVCQSKPRQDIMKRYCDPDDVCCDVLIKLPSITFLTGGIDVSRSEFPHMVGFLTYVPLQGKGLFSYREGMSINHHACSRQALLGYGPDMDSAQWLCAGSVISERFVLTAGHCLSQPQFGEVKYIVLGIRSRSDPPKYWQNYNVKRRVRHPEYKPPSKYNDIALLETVEKIEFNKDVIPACLHTSGIAAATVSTSGWGALGHRKQLADIMQKGDLHRYEEDECVQHYPKHRHMKHGYNHTTQMCYGGRETIVDTCQGDSGGPLQSNIYDEHLCMFTIVGVTSAGKQCGLELIPGLYTRVQHYVPWIESIVWP